MNGLLQLQGAGILRLFEGAVLRGDVGAGDAVVPAQVIFIPERPQKSHEGCAAGDDVTEAAPHQLARLRRRAVKTYQPQPGKNHAWGGAAHHGEQGEILRIKQRENSAENNSIESSQ